MYFKCDAVHLNCHLLMTFRQQIRLPSSGLPHVTNSRPRRTEERFVLAADTRVVIVNKHTCTYQLIPALKLLIDTLIVLRMGSVQCCVIYLYKVNCSCRLFLDISSCIRCIGVEDAVSDLLIGLHPFNEILKPSNFYFPAKNSLPRLLTPQIN